MTKDTDPEVSQLNAWFSTLPLQQRTQVRTYEDLRGRDFHRLLWSLMGGLAIVGLAVLVEAVLGASDPKKVASLGWGVAGYALLLLGIRVFLYDVGRFKFLVRYWQECGFPELPPAGFRARKARRAWVEDRLQVRRGRKTAA